MESIENEFVHLQFQDELEQGYENGQNREMGKPSFSIWPKGCGPEQWERLKNNRNRMTRKHRLGECENRVVETRI